MHFDVGSDLTMILSVVWAFRLGCWVIVALLVTFLRSFISQAVFITSRSIQVSRKQFADVLVLDDGCTS